MYGMELQGRRRGMDLSITDTSEVFSIKIDDKEIENVARYSISSDSDILRLRLELAIPKSNVTIQVDH